MLKSLHNSLFLEYCRKWKRWHSNLLDLLWKTQGCSLETVDCTRNLADQWEELIKRVAGTWEKIVKCQSVEAGDLDEEEEIEQGL